MKNWNLMLLALVTLLAFACTPNQVCIHLPDNSNHCIDDSTVVYWLREDNGVLAVSKLNNIPKNFAQYPQYSTPVTLVNGNYIAELHAGNLTLTLPGSNTGNVTGFQMNTDSQFGVFLMKTDSGTFMTASETQGCDIHYVDADQSGWKVFDETYGDAIRVATEVTHTDIDGTRILKRKVETHPEITRHKGTVVVLIDNFRLERGPTDCCDESCFGCCKFVEGARVTLPATFASEHLPTYSDYQQQSMFDLAATCISIQCEWLRVANCEKRTVECYNTITCATDLWINADHSIGAVYDSACTMGARSSTLCIPGAGSLTDSRH